MKKIGILIIVLCSVINVIKAQNVSANCYRGFIDAGYTIGIGDYKFGRFEINLSHGYQFSSYVFFGIGTGFHFMQEYKTPNMDIALDVRESSLEMPLFANLKFNFSKSKITPFVDLKAGKYLTNNGELYANLSAGLRISTNKKHAINISIGYTLQNLEFEQFDSFNNSNSMSYTREGNNYDAEGVAIKVGYEF